MPFACVCDARLRSPLVAGGWIEFPPAVGSRAHGPCSLSQTLDVFGSSTHWLRCCSSASSSVGG
eukprot:8033692-Alexandrium_andersonii.AAC.1